MSSLIAKKISEDELVGSLLIGASMVLTTHSIARMVFLRRAASKFFLFPIINVAQLLNQVFVFLLITTAIGTITFDVALWLNVLNNVAYFITKPTVMYLAYLRCSAVLPILKKGEWIHYTLVAIRATELFGIVIVNIATNVMCRGSLAPGTRCESFHIAWTIRDAGAPVFRFYVIICEAIFYYKLFGTLRGMTNGKHAKVLRYRRLQTSLFTVDLIIMTYMSVYRIIGIWNKSLPTYVYLELFSSTLTIFNLTEFGLNIRSLFGAASDGQPHTSSFQKSSSSKVEMRSIDGSGSGGGHHFGGESRHFGSIGNDGDDTGYTLYHASSSSQSAAEEGRQTPSYNRHHSSSSTRPLTSSSSNSPLTAYPGPAGNSGSSGGTTAVGSELDLSSPTDVRREGPFFPIVDPAPVVQTPSPSSTAPLYRPPFNFGHPATTGTGSELVSNYHNHGSNGNNNKNNSSGSATVARSRSLDEPWRLTIAELINGREQLEGASNGQSPSYLADPYTTLDTPLSSSKSSSASTVLAQQQQKQHIIDPASFRQQAQWASTSPSSSPLSGSGGDKRNASQDRNPSASPRLPSAAPSPRLATSNIVINIDGARSSESEGLASPSRPHRALIMPDRAPGRRRS
ncbi:hypothetical protein BGW41_004586 [Actinomortierella wolfii]|nr:hypothetical protein BGW41_004586 [Actinomortierella wolfii]